MLSRFLLSKGVLEVVEVVGGGPEVATPDCVAVRSRDIATGNRQSREDHVCALPPPFPGAHHDHQMMKAVAETQIDGM